MRDHRDVNRETSLKGVEGQSFRQKLLLFCIQLYAQGKLMIKSQLRLKKKRHPCSQSNFDIAATNPGSLCH